MTFQIDMSKVDTSYWRDHPNIVKPDWLWPGYHCVLDKEIRRDWGITCGDYFDIFDLQGGKCALCGKISERRFDVDHDHETGEIRGLLCRKCNRNLSQQITEYLRNPPAREFHLVVTLKKVKSRDKRLATKRRKNARVSSTRKPESVVVDLSADAEEKLKRALESSA